MASTQPRHDARLLELDSIRALAALIVVLNHIPAWNPVLYQWTLLRQGGLMVDLFFVLSGFIIQLTYGERIKSFKNLLGFQLIRLGRLYPVHLLFLAVFVGIEALKHLGSTSLGAGSPNLQFHQQSTMQAFWEHLPMLQGVLPNGNILTFNAPSWSISVEFYTYLLFGIFVLLAKQAKSMVFFITWLISTAMLVSGNFDQSLWLLRCLSGFFLGCMLSVGVAKLPAVVPTWVSEFSICALFSLIFTGIPHPHDYIVVTLLSAVIIAAITLRAPSNGKGPIASALSQPGMVYLGSLSFTIYMAHSAVIWVSNQIARFVLKWPDQFVFGSFKPQANLTYALIWTAVTVLMVIACARLVTKFIEQPARTRTRNLAKRLLT